MYEMYSHDEVVKAVKAFAELVGTHFGESLRDMLADGEAEVVGIIAGQFAFRMVPKPDEPK